MENERRGHGNGDAAQRDHRHGDTATTGGSGRTRVHQKREVSSCPRRTEGQRSEEWDST